MESHILCKNFRPIWCSRKYWNKKITCYCPEPLKSLRRTVSQNNYWFLYLNLFKSCFISLTFINKFNPSVARIKVFQDRKVPKRINHAYLLSIKYLKGNYWSIIIFQVIIFTPNLIGLSKLPMKCQMQNKS